MRRTLLVLAAVLACAAPAVAAQGVPDPASPTATRETAVVFGVRGRLRTSSGLASLPVELVERLSRDPALATLTIGPPSGATGVVVARWVFADEAAFRGWYARAETRESLHVLGTVLDSPDYAFTLKRFPAAITAEAAQATP